MAYFHLRLVPPRSMFPHDASVEDMDATDHRAARLRADADRPIADRRLGPGLHYEIAASLILRHASASAA